MKIAVVGGGLAGLSICWHLLHQAHPPEVVLYEYQEIGEGASGVSTGLLHPMPGKYAGPSWRGEEAMEASLGLIEVVERYLQEPLALRTGILRLALTEDQKAAFCEPKRGAFFLCPSTIFKQLPVVTKALGGLWIPEGVTVFCRKYLLGLMRLCCAEGMKWEKKRIHRVEEIEEFDYRIWATGAEISYLGEKAKGLALGYKKGQVLICKWPQDLAPFSSALIGNGHISHMQDSTLCQLGSTYEADLFSRPEAAYHLREKIGAFFPPAAFFEIVGIRSGIRASPLQGHRPILKEISPKTWVCAGLGSRGLLYHALLARDLVSALDYLG